MRLRYARAILFLGLAFFGVSACLPAAAAPSEDIRTPITTEVPIPISGNTPGSTPERVADYLASGRVEDVAQYIGIIYNFLISIVGMVAAVMMVVGGFQYLTSAGDSGKIGAAKSRMADALIGLVLALGAYTILNTINPRLLQLKLPNVTDVKAELIAMPWCDVLKAKQIDVNPIQGDPNKCGSVGEYMAGKDRLTCIYRAPCPNYKASELPDVLKTSTGMRSTCVQTLTTNAYVNDPFTPDQVLKFLERSDAFARLGIPDCWKEFNVPSGCNDAQAQQWRQNHSTWTNPTNGKVRDCPREMGVAACDYNNLYSWAQNVVKEELPPVPFGTKRSAEELSGTVSYFARCMSCLEYGAVEEKRSKDVAPGGFVYQTPHENRCAYWQDEANADVAFVPGAWDKRKAMNQPILSYCRWMPTEGGCAQADFTCKEPTASSSCSNYNSIRPFFMFDIEHGGFAWWIYGYDKNGTLSARPDALANVCSANPCGYNPGKGCTGAGGIINGIRTAAAVVRDGIAGIQSCDDK
ncbi:MAG TPA: pilin [Candidatus Baltobacteraceae bacterium]|nr:pilin [Candidatus Baltobacteraceae bacterium]